MVVNTRWVAETNEQCCVNALAAPVSRTEAARLAVSLKALADPTRIQLLSIIRDAGESGACVCDLTAHVALRQPTVSHHLRVLADAGLVRREQRGTWAWFSLEADSIDQLLRLLSTLTTAKAH